MNVVVALVVVVVSASLAIGAILLVRRRAPEGSYFNDGDRAAGVFGVLATALPSCSASSWCSRSRALTTRARAPRPRR